MPEWPGGGEKVIPVAGCLEGLLVDGVDKCTGLFLSALPYVGRFEM